MIDADIPLYWVDVTIEEGLNFHNELSQNQLLTIPS